MILCMTYQRNYGNLYERSASLDFHNILIMIL